MKLSDIQRWALYIFFFSINFEVWDPFNTSGFFSVSKFTGLIYFASILPNILQFTRFNRLKRFLFPIWGFFGLLILVSILHINYISQSFFDFSLFQNIILLTLLINHRRKEPGVLERGLLSFALGSFILSLLFIAGIGIEYTDEGRVSLFGDNENSIGMRMSISIIILFLAVFQNQLHLNKYRFILLAFIPIMLRLMAETGSRVAFFSFALMFIIGGVLIKTKKAWYKIFVLVLAACAFLIVFQYVMQSEVLRSRLVSSSESGDLAGRDVIWAKLLPLINNNPIFGVGRTGYALYTKDVFNGTQSPHNVFIEVLCYTGIFGLGFYLLFIFGAAKRAYIAYYRRNQLLPLLLLVPIGGLILSGQILTSKIGWIIFAYAIASGIFSRRIHKLSKSSKIYHENSLCNRLPRIRRCTTAISRTSFRF